MKLSFFVQMIPPTVKWRDVPGYEGLYCISQNGDVYSNYSKKLLHPYVASDGYLRINLCKNKRTKIKMLHRIVAEAFIPNPYNLPVVNHIDGNKANPMIGNLEWTTFSENSLHAYSAGLSHVSEKCRKAVSMIAAENGAKTTSLSVKQFDLYGNLIREYSSYREAERKTGIPKSNISRACKSDLYSAGGYKWKNA